jgi:hypothetical protein
MATGKQRFLAFIIVVPIVIGISAIAYKIDRNKTIERFAHPTIGQIYTTKNGAYFRYKKIKSITKDSINFYLSNYEGIRGDKLSDILEKKDAFSNEEKSYSRVELRKMLEAEPGDNSLFDITDPDN